MVIYLHFDSQGGKGGTFWSRGVVKRQEAEKRGEIKSFINFNNVFGLSVSFI